MAGFHMNVWANIVAAAIFLGVLWLIQKRRGGRCPLCNQRPS